jgi:alpha,alpha-trehalase
MRIYFFSVLILFLFIFCGHQKKTQSDEILIEQPEKLYGQLFYDVQNSDLYEFRDSKTFCDAVPLFPVKDIVNSYLKIKSKTDSAFLKEFIKSNFTLPVYKSFFQKKTDILNHIHILWDTLTRGPDLKTSGTLINLPEKYVIPGGRFREVYYWDSYFTMLGLQAENRTEVIENMINNFSFLIDTFGFVPNGNRTYYMSRSQPPFYSLMIGLLSKTKNDDNIYIRYIYRLKKEYDFWMDGSNELSGTKHEYRRIVWLDDSTILNRYWDDSDIPRSESYREDCRLADKVKTMYGRSKNDFYRNIRAAAESGWDFSSRWLKDTFNLCSIHTIEIVPVDLNCLLFNLEMTLSRCYELKHLPDSAACFKQKAVKRLKAINKYCWNNYEGYYMDYDFKEKKQTGIFSLAGVYPLFFNIADSCSAQNVSKKILNIFLKDGGVVTTNLRTGQQWDAPNGWAPLQYITIIGLRNYGITKLADTIKSRWLNLNKKVYSRTAKMVEKYDVMDISKFGGGGEYPNQDGFGWTNGVFEILSLK